MRLYLCQHGEALTKDVDPDRPLSERGVADICNIASTLGDAIQIQAVAHSGKTRARQTAELLHERLAPDAPIRAESGLGANDPVEDFAAELASRESGLMVVGHMPFVGHLASHLLGEPGRNLLAFQPGTVAALERDEHGAWRVAWMLTPELAGA